ncbi:MAG: hypothetical protein GY935_25755 [Gammaproteobacteria bacterium]|nr:hypothetical protein [Gammaproteobacteria bacterium]
MSPTATSVLTLKHAILGGGHTAPIERITATERKALDVALNTRLAEEISCLAERLGPKVASELKASRLYYSAHRDLSLVEAFKAVLEKSRGRKLTKTQREKIDVSLEEVAGAAERVADVLGLDVPIGDNPLLEETLERFLTREIGRIAGFDDKTLGLLEKEEVNLTLPGGAGIDHLVTRKVITEAEGRTLSYLGALSRLSGSNLTLVKALHGGDRQSVKDFITWDRSDWEKLIKDNRIDVPEGEKDASGYAESLILAMERSFPSDYFAARIAKERFDAEIKLVDEIVARKKYGAALIRDGVVDETAVNTKGLSAAARKKLKGRLADFGRLAKTYRHMGIADIANDDRLKPGEKSHLIERRLGGLKVFFDNNPSLDLYVADFVDRTITFDWTKINKEDQPHIKNQVRAMQRVTVLTDNTAHSLALMAAGFSSAADIAAVREEEFLSTSGLDRFEGHAIYARAYENSVAVSHLFEGIREVSNEARDSVYFTPSAKLHKYLHDLDGYAELFGNQNYCDCKHCRSVLSPSAYFVDLMLFIKDSVTSQIAGSVQTGSVLQERRPDLWDLDLSCRRAKTELPYLEIVNEVLAAFLETSTAPEFADVEAALADGNNSVELPINLPLEELRLYLAEFDLSLADVYRLRGEEVVTIRRERLALSEEELKLIIAPNPGGVGKRFGNLPLANMDVQDFMKFAKVTRDEVTAILSVSALSEITEVGVAVVPLPDDIQLFTEHLTDLTSERLDKIHRFMRLVRKTGYTIVETDHLLEGLAKAGLMTKLEDMTPGVGPAVLWLAPLFDLRDSLDLSAEELAVFAGRLPDDILIAGEEGFFDRLFDRLAIFGRANQDDEEPIILKADAPMESVQAFSHLGGGLGVSEADLTSLLALHKFDFSANIKIDDIVSLYRHVRMARGLGIPVADLITLIELGDPAADPAPLKTIEDFVTVSEQAVRLKNSTFKLGLLYLVLTGKETPGTVFEATTEAAVEIVLTLHEAKVSERPGLLVAALEDRYSLQNEQLQRIFLKYLTTFDLSDAGIVTALAADFDEGQPVTPADLDRLVDLMRELERLTRTFDTLDLSTETVDDLALNPSHYEVANPRALTLADILVLMRRTDLMRADGAGEDGLREAQKAYLGNPSLTPEIVATLAEQLDVPEVMVSAAAEELPLPSTPIATFTRVAGMVALAKMLNVDGLSLVKLRKTDNKGIEEARDVVFAAVQAKYVDDDARRETRLSELAEHTNMRRRDALAAFIIGHHPDFGFKDHSDLYRFFLLDTEMSGCFLTSRVICAISSLQTYINRCLLNLEPPVSPSWIPSEEWEWRRNYRVWEANRKVFLYPENWIDPALRNDKSHLFEALEKELLQQKITDESAENAYKRYVAGFTELAGLRYAGAFTRAPLPNQFIVPEAPGENKLLMAMMPMPESVMNMEEMEAFSGNLAVSGYSQSAGVVDYTYYLFARTSADPYQFFYRTYLPRRGVWGNWIRMDLPIEADSISVAMHRGRLHVFWNDVKYKEINKISEGGASSNEVRFEITTKYASLDENGEWTPVQKMSLGTLSKFRYEIFADVMGVGFPKNEGAQDRIKEEVYAEFIRKMFSKPYATITSDSTRPVSLSYIWSPQQRIIVQYKTGDIKVTKGSMTVTSSGAVFSVTNNQFYKTPSTLLSLSIRFSALSQYTGKGTLTIFDASNCVLKYKKWTWKIPIEQVTSWIVNDSVYTTETGVSLSRNKILDFSPTAIDERRPDGSYLSINISTRKHLKKEQALGGSAFYVENNRPTFTKSRRIVGQTVTGDATLTLPHPYLPGADKHVTLNTVLTAELGEILFDRGLETFLSLSTQQMIDPDHDGLDLDFDGPYGQYYWEMFLHIPFLIARHFNANQKFKEAKWWYERIFNPTMVKSPTDTPPSDHVWQFREFRNQDVDRLKDILTDEAAIAAYHSDPFNPHAIAKLRHSAYQKAVVIGYVDNLIDWADDLFARDTRESVTEATGLYMFARDILGDRPAQIGDCETADPLSWKGIEGVNSGGSEFLIMVLVLLENLAINRRNRLELAVKPVREMKALEAELRANNVLPPLTRLDDIRKAVEIREVKDKVAEFLRDLVEENEARIRLPNGDVMSPREAEREGLLTAELPHGQPAMIRGSFDNAVVAYREAVGARVQPFDRMADTFGVDRDTLARHVVMPMMRRHRASHASRQLTVAFCVPHNPNMLYLWDRIDMQLTKIRNCKNIDGVVRKLALTEPPIDPFMIVRAGAAGLSLEDIVALASDADAAPPAYRFMSLLPAAKQAAQMVQGFGQSLLSALEKKDAEELKFLQFTHERNIQALTKSVKKRQIREANEQLKAAEESLARAEINLEYYNNLIEEGLTGWEIAEQVSTHTATRFRISEAKGLLAAGLVHLLPQIGSAFAMKFGGLELGFSAEKYGQMSSAMAGVASQIAQSAGLEARSQRREQDWKHQRKTARVDVKAQTASFMAAEIRLALAEKDLEIHERVIEQTTETEEFHKDKFTGLSLYNHMASKLSRIYRSAYEVAYGLAHSAERAYQFETDDNTSFFVASDNWDQSYAGLLAGEHLTVQLAAMEANFLNINTRRPEIKQTFSLVMLDGQALIDLRQTGTCKFSIPEVAFEMLYPGQYRRLIKAVRVSVPAVVGPYTNVSAKLTLKESMVKVEETSANLEPGRKATTEAISLSGAMNDSGMFEFAYRDERFLPFEGAGAISSWQLDLPSSIRSFDYDTIADVLFHLDYTALDGDREAAELNLATMIETFATNQDQGLFRLISLRHEFPNEWARLTRPAPAAPKDVVFTLIDTHFPHLFHSREVQISATTVYLRPKDGAIVVPPDLSLNDFDIDWDANVDIERRPGIVSADDTDKLKGGTVAALNGPAKRDWQFNDGEGKLDSTTTDDLMILIRYTVTMS